MNSLTNAFIFARGGSKGIKNKNLILINGKPLIYWSIKNCLNSGKISSTWVSSDNKKTFVITKGLDSCIWVYPLIFWKKIENDLKKLSSISNTNRAFIRNTARYASPVKFDKQG